MEGIFFIRDKAGHFISALLKENSKKEPRLFSEFFFIILTAKSPDTSSHPKTAETPGPACPARGLFLHEDDIESSRRAWTRHSMHRAFSPPECAEADEDKTIAAL